MYATLSFAGRPVLSLVQVLCHCIVCRKLSSGPYSTNTCVLEQDFKIEKGTLKEYRFTGGSGNVVTIYFCDICSTLMYSKCVDVANGGFIIVIKTGILSGGMHLM